MVSKVEEIESPPPGDRLFNERSEKPFACVFVTQLSNEVCELYGHKIAISALKIVHHIGSTYEEKLLMTTINEISTYAPQKVFGLWINNLCLHQQKIDSHKPYISTRTISRPLIPPSLLYLAEFFLCYNNSSSSGFYLLLLWTLFKYEELCATSDFMVQRLYEGCTKWHTLKPFILTLFHIIHFWRV